MLLGIMLLPVPVALLLLLTVPELLLLLLLFVVVVPPAAVAAPSVNSSKKRKLVFQVEFIREIDCSYLGSILSHACGSAFSS